MGAIRRSRTAVAILVLFLVVGLAYMALAEVLGYRPEIDLETGLAQLLASAASNSR